MNNSKIEWCDMTWNPVTGCLHSCRETYCYAAGIAKRFGKCKGAAHKFDEIFAEPFGEAAPGNIHELERPVVFNGKIDPYPYGFDPTFHRYRLDEPARKPKPQMIFVVSMGDLFGDWIPNEWIKAVFDACEAAPQHVYMFLSKNPARMLKLAESGLFPTGNNYWYGSTITSAEEKFFYHNEINTFISIEPILSDFGEAGIFSLMNINWVIVGAETGGRKEKVIPEKQWIQNLVNVCESFRIPIFLKNNLTNIWGEPLIQEYPWESKDDEEEKIK